MRAQHRHRPIVHVPTPSSPGRCACSKR
jgi:hypothetical protein